MLKVADSKEAFIFIKFFNWCRNMYKDKNDFERQKNKKYFKKCSVITSGKKQGNTKIGITCESENSEVMGVKGIFLFVTIYYYWLF